MNSSIAAVAVAFLGFAPNATLPGVPISKEHHHHLVVENSFVKAYEVQVPPHAATLMHQHVHDYVYIVFGNAEFTNAVAGKPEVKAKAADLAVNFSPGPFAHVVTNDGDAPFRNITIELLHPQGELKKYYASLNEALFAGSSGLESGEATVLETADMRVQAVRVRPREKWATPADGHNRLVIVTDLIGHTSAPEEKNAPFPAGMLQWVPAGQSWTASNDSTDMEKLMVLEFKGGTFARPGAYH